MQWRATKPHLGLRVSPTPPNGYTRALADPFTPTVDGETQKRVGNHCLACWCFASKPCKNLFCLQDGRTSHKIPPRPLDSAPWRFPGCSCRLGGKVPHSFLSSSYFPSLSLSTSRSKETPDWFLPPSSHGAQVFLTAERAPSMSWEGQTWSAHQFLSPQLLWVPNHVILPICLMAM